MHIEFDENTSEPLLYLHFLVALASPNYLNNNDRVLVIDDFLATGEASRGMIEIVHQAGATLVGVGIVIEKAFQDGGNSLRDEGVRVESLARIAKLENGSIYFL